jgi:hypothetical protein
LIALIVGFIDGVSRRLRYVISVLPNGRVFFDRAILRSLRYLAESLHPGLLIAGSWPCGCISPNAEHNTFTTTTHTHSCSR